MASIDTFDTLNFCISAYLPDILNLSGPRLRVAVYQRRIFHSARETGLVSHHTEPVLQNFPQHAILRI